MGFLRRFRESPEERAQREAQEADARAQKEREREAAQQAGQEARLREILGDDLFEIDVATPQQAKLAIKLARLRKKELQAEKRDLASQLTDHREEWRQRQSGRVSTVALGRGTSGRLIRAGVQGKRRGERMQHANTVNAFSDAKQEFDSQILVIDRLIIELERKALG